MYTAIQTTIALLYNKSDKNHSCRFCCHKKKSYYNINQSPIKIRQMIPFGHQLLK